MPRLVGMRSSTGTEAASPHSAGERSWTDDIAAHIAATTARVNKAADALEQMAERQLAKAGFRQDAKGTWREPSMAKAIGRLPDRAGKPAHEPGDIPQGRHDAPARPTPRSRPTARPSSTTIGSRYLDEQDVRALGSKATLGTTDATGGWIIPNAVVDDITTAKTAKSIYTQLMTVRTGVRSFAVDLPFRSAAPNPGRHRGLRPTKENVDLAYNGYSATCLRCRLGSMDIGNQFLRQSQGAAEADVSRFARPGVRRGRELLHPRRCPGDRLRGSSSRP